MKKHTSSSIGVHIGKSLEALRFMIVFSARRVKENLLFAGLFDENIVKKCQEHSTNKSQANHSLP